MRGYGCYKFIIILHCLIHIVYYVIDLLKVFNTLNVYSGLK